MEDVFALARQHAHVVAVLKVDDANRTRLPTDRLWHSIVLLRRRRRRYGRGSCPRTRRWDIRQFVVLVVLRHLFDSVRTRTRFRIRTSRDGGGPGPCLFCFREFVLGIAHLVSRMLSIPMGLKILRFRLSTTRAKLDEWESVEDRACEDASTTSSPGVSCSNSDTITLGVADSTDDLSQFEFVSACSNFRSPEKVAYASDDDHCK